MVNEIVDGLKKERKTKVHLRVVAFDTYTRCVRAMAELSPKSEDRFSFVYNGSGTALYTATDECTRFNAEECTYLLIVITDGEDNMSPELSRSTFNNRLRDSKNLTVAIHVPNERSRSTMVTAGIPVGNINVWAQTEEGTREVAQKTVVGTAQYLKSRAAGKTQVDTFFADLSKLKPKAVRTKLDDVGRRIRVMKVDREEGIREFIERKTKKPYIIGSAYYQLTKPELIQPTKAVMIREKTGSAIWGGDKARELLGLPTGASAKVTPGNLALYDVFVESRSVNRKLVRGTVLLLDKLAKDGKIPTWNHLAAGV